MMALALAIDKALARCDRLSQIIEEEEARTGLIAASRRSEMGVYRALLYQDGRGLLKHELPLMPYQDPDNLARWHEVLQKRRKEMAEMVGGE